MDARKIYRFLITTTFCNFIPLYLLIPVSYYSSKWLFLRTVISFQQNVSESEAFLIIELQNTFITSNVRDAKRKMYINNTNK